jgi:hypothetical protein
MFPSVSFYSPCSPPFSFFFFSVFLPPLFHRLSLAFISQRMPCGATFNMYRNSSRETFLIIEALCCFCF